MSTGFICFHPDNFGGCCALRGLARNPDHNPMLLSIIAGFCGLGERSHSMANIVRLARITLQL